MRFIPALVLVSACGFQVSATGDASIGDDASSGDAGSDANSDSGVLDTDGDGVLDAVDNCRTTPNREQRDHDLDALGDVCDPCPHLPRPNLTLPEPDGDHDGVGDQCDPNPMTPGDTIKLFEGFDSSTATATWAGNGSWVVTNGALRQMANGNGPFIIGPPITVKRAYVTTQFTIVTLGPNAGVGVSSLSLEPHSYECSVARAGAGTTVHVDGRWPGMGTTENTIWSGTFAVGSTIRLTLDLRVQTDCFAKQDSNEARTTAAYGPNIVGTPILATQDAKADFDYVFIVEETP